jgi:DNA helicase II / ATP-dependent DNA helicase PcrA
MENDFSRSFNRLNKEQQAAVNHIYGPLLVIAGPGTGKTELLSVRVANILDKTDSDPASILCLTFTNMAATNMQERLIGMIGHTASNVNVSTFHSFAADIMQTYPDYFWNGAKLSVVPDALELELLSEVLESLPLDNPLTARYYNRLTQLNDIKSALKLTKEAGLSPDKLLAIIDANEAYINKIELELAEILSDKLSFKKLDELASAINNLPDQHIDELISPLISMGTVIKRQLTAAINSDKQLGKTLNTSKWKRGVIQTLNGQKGMHDEKKRLLWWRALADVYSKFQDLILSRGYYDYSDMLIEVNAALEKHPDLLAVVSERFLFVLIDEFQDTNAAQLRLAQLIVSSGINADQPNIMVVGDDDQSIYAFNGAELSNMISFIDNYPEVKTIVLTKNYRSTSQIVDVSKSIISNADDRLVNYIDGISKNLVSNLPDKSQRIEHLSYPTKEHQLSFLAKDIASNYKNNPKSEIAVLARSHTPLKDLSHYLAKENVPISYEKQNNILDIEVIKLIEVMSEIISEIHNGNEQALDYLLPKMLSYPPWQIKPLTLWQLALSIREKRSHWFRSMTTSKDRNIHDIAHWLLLLSTEAQYQPVQILLEYIIGIRQTANYTSPLKDYYLQNKEVDSNYLTTISAVNFLIKLIVDYSALSPDSLKLSDFNKFLKLSYFLGTQITDQSWFVSGDNTVKLLSVHKAKGLEYDTVYILNAVDKDWRPRASSRKPPMNLPIRDYGEQYSDYARLAYVAASRAKNSLIVSSYKNDSQNNAMLASPLFNEIKQIEASADEKDSQLIDVLEQAIAWPRLSSKDEKALLSPVLDNYSLSATALLHFLDITRGGPVNFFERQILRLPSLLTPQMVYGTAMHKALQFAQNLANNNSLTLGKVQKSYEKSLTEQNRLTNQDLEKYKVYGKDVLNNLFKNLDFSLPSGGQSELVLNNKRIAGAILGGTLDHILLSGNDLIISDYKTGKPIKSLSLNSGNSAVSAWRHRTQLLFYCILIKDDYRFQQVKTTKAQMIYLEAEQANELILDLVPDRDELSRLEALISGVWQAIMSLELPDITKYPQDIKGIKAFEEDIINKKVTL